MRAKGLAHWNRARESEPDGTGLAASGAAYRLGCVLELPHRAACILQQYLARRGQFDLAAVAAEQRRPDLGFDGLDLD
jgi:hypothetical protein